MSSNFLMARDDVDPVPFDSQENGLCGEYHKILVKGIYLNLGYTPESL